MSFFFLQQMVLAWFFILNPIPISNNSSLGLAWMGLASLMVGNISFDRSATHPGIAFVLIKPKLVFNVSVWQPKKSTMYQGSAHPLLWAKFHVLVSDVCSESGSCMWLLLSIKIQVKLSGANAIYINWYVCIKVSLGINGRGRASLKGVGYRRTGHHLWSSSPNKRVWDFR